MNIIIVGGGSKFGKFVSDEFNKLEHNVYILSHQNYGNENPNHLYADFRNITEVTSVFKSIVEKVDTLDLFLYVSSFDDGPKTPEHYQVNNTGNIEKMWNNTLRVNVVIPHELSLIALEKTTKNSKIVFMTSGLAEDFDERKHFFSYAAYAGCKAALSHLMIALAHNNEELVCALSPHFPDEEDLKIKKYQETFDRLISLTNDDKGKIIRLY